MPGKRPVATTRNRVHTRTEGSKRVRLPNKRFGYHPGQKDNRTSYGKRGSHPSAQLRALLHSVEGRKPTARRAPTCRPPRNIRRTVGGGSTCAMVLPPPISQGNAMFSLRALTTHTLCRYNVEEDVTCHVLGWLYIIPTNIGESNLDALHPFPLEQREKLFLRP